MMLTVGQGGWTHQGTHGDKRTPGRSSRQVRVTKRLNCIGVEGGILCANKTNRAGSNLPKTCQDFNSWPNAMLRPLCSVERDTHTVMKKSVITLEQQLNFARLTQQEVDHLACIVEKEEDGTRRTTPAAWTCECESSFVTFEKKFLRVSCLPIGLYPQMKCLNWIGCYVFTVLKIKADRELTQLGVDWFAKVASCDWIQWHELAYRTRNGLWNQGQQGRIFVVEL